jgi:hypothetical protein
MVLIILAEGTGTRIARFVTVIGFEVAMPFPLAGNLLHPERRRAQSRPLRPELGGELVSWEITALVLYGRPRFSVKRIGVTSRNFTKFYNSDEIHCDLIFDETPRPISPLSICHPPFPLARFGSSEHSTFRTKEQILSNLRVCGSFFWG